MDRTSPEGIDAEDSYVVDLDKVDRSRLAEVGAKAANLGHVAPHDLRRSVAGALQEAGVSIENISRLLRHSNVAVTERYLSRLPQRNEGGIMMSDLLGLEEVDWPGL